MPTSPDTLCRICRDPSRYKVEQLYLDGDLSTIRQQHRYAISEVDAHMGHLTDPDTLRQVTGLASATAVAARLRQLEQASRQILELAIAQEDGKLALQALRETRATLVEVARLADALDSQQSTSVERLDLDDAIADYVRGKRVDDSPAEGEPRDRQPVDGRALPTGERRALLSPEHAPRHSGA